MKKIPYSILTLCLGLVLSSSGCKRGTTDHDPVVDPNVTDVGVSIIGVTWATRNVDTPGKFAAKPEDPGMFYQWNRKVGWSVNNPMKNSDGGVIWDNTSSTATAWAPENDPCPDGWRVPNKTEIDKLANAAVVKKADVLGGKKVVSFTDGANTIYLPAAGNRHLTDGSFQSYNSEIWGSTEGTNNTFGYGLTYYYTPTTITGGNCHKPSGCFVRCVKGAK